MLSILLSNVAITEGDGMLMILSTQLSIYETVKNMKTKTEAEQHCCPEIVLCTSIYFAKILIHIL